MPWPGSGPASQCTGYITATLGAWVGPAVAVCGLAQAQLRYLAPVASPGPQLPPCFCIYLFPLFYFSFYSAPSQAARPGPRKGKERTGCVPGPCHPRLLHDHHHSHNTPSRLPHAFSPRPHVCIFAPSLPPILLPRKLFLPAFASFRLELASFPLVVLAKLLPSFWNTAYHPAYFNTTDLVLSFPFSFPFLPSPLFFFSFLFCIVIFTIVQRLYVFISVSVLCFVRFATPIPLRLPTLAPSLASPFPFVALAAWPILSLFFARIISVQPPSPLTISPQIKTKALENKAPAAASESPFLSFCLFDSKPCACLALEQNTKQHFPPGPSSSQSASLRVHSLRLGFFIPAAARPSRIAFSSAHPFLFSFSPLFSLHFSFTSLYTSFHHFLIYQPNLSITAVLAHIF